MVHERRILDLVLLESTLHLSGTTRSLSDSSSRSSGLHGVILTRDIQDHEPGFFYLRDATGLVLSKTGHKIRT